MRCGLLRSAGTRLLSSACKRAHMISALAKIELAVDISIEHFHGRRMWQQIMLRCAAYAALRGFLPPSGTGGGAPLNHHELILRGAIWRKAELPAHGLFWAAQMWDDLSFGGVIRTQWSWAVCIKFRLYALSSTRIHRIWPLSSDLLGMQMQLLMRISAYGSC